MSTIDATLAERGSRYGEFPEHAFITQELKRTLHDNVNWSNLADDQKEALDMVMHKIGRIINGDPNYIDSWTDIIGYTRLVEKRLIAGQAEPKLKDIEAEATGNPFIGAFIRAMKDAIENSDEPCDDPECPACHPMATAKDTKPSRDAVMSALNVLLKAGVIRQAD